MDRPHPDPRAEAQFMTDEGVQDYLAAIRGKLSAAWLEVIQPVDEMLKNAEKHARENGNDALADRIAAEREALAGEKKSARVLSGKLSLPSLSGPTPTDSQGSESTQLPPQETPKKRGRPTNAERDARIAAASLNGSSTTHEENGKPPSPGGPSPEAQ